MLKVASNPRPAAGIVRALSLLLLFGLFCIAAAPAHADSYVDVALTNVTVTGNNSCSPAPCSETFNISFEWDTTSNAYVFSTVSIATTGFLGEPFEAGESCSGCAQPYLIFTSSKGDGLQWETSDDSFPSPGTYSVTSPAFVVDFSCSPDPVCVAASPDTSGCCTDWDTTGGTITVTAVSPVGTAPEPSSLFLLGSGLVGLAGIRNKRPAQFRSLKDCFRRMARPLNLKAVTP
jgi:hypothetical protein